MKKVVLIFGGAIVLISICMAVKKSFAKGTNAVPRIANRSDETPTKID